MSEQIDVTSQTVAGFFVIAALTQAEDEVSEQIKGRYADVTLLGRPRIFQRETPVWKLRMGI